MPRKKVVKSAARKKQPSKQAKQTKPANKNQSTNLIRLESEFNSTPARLAEQHAKEIAVLTQKENKLHVTLQKIQAQAVKIEKAIASAAKLKTAAGKKQLQAAKKALNDTKKDYTITNAALKTVMTELNAAEIRLAKFDAIAKLLKQFAKDWSKQAKKLQAKAKEKVAAKAKTSAKAKTKPKTKANRRTKANETSPSPVLTVIEQPQFDSLDQPAEQSEFDDIKEATS